MIKVFKAKGAFEWYLVDAELLPILEQRMWRFMGGYAVYVSPRGAPKKEIISMHSEVVRLRGEKVPKGYVIDHINQNPKDNRSANLRVVTRAVNLANTTIENQLKRKQNGIRLGKRPKTEKQLESAKKMMGRLKALGLNGGVKKGTRGVPVVDLYSGLVYVNLAAAADAHGFKLTSVRNRLNGSSNKVEQRWAYV